MGFSFNGLSGAAVTLSGGITTSVSIPSASQTLINKTITGNAGTQTIHTVTAGKTFYLYGFAQDPGTAGTSTFIIYANDGTTIRLQGRSTASGAGTSFASGGGGCPIASWAATEAVKILAPNNSVNNIWGVEV